jgi:hypothetical protein
VNPVLEYKWAILFLANINTGTWPSRLGEFRMRDSKILSLVPLDSGPRMTALASPAANCRLHTRPLVRVDAPHKKNPIV